MWCFDQNVANKCHRGVKIGYSKVVYTQKLYFAHKLNKTGFKEGLRISLGAGEV